MRYARHLSTAVAVIVALNTSTTFAKDKKSDAVVAVRAGELHVGNGEVIKDGIILIENGRIARVGADLKIPEGVERIEIEQGALTPGLIDANAEVSPRNLMVPKHARTASEVVRDLFEAHKGHHHRAGVDCCGSRCPLSMLHVSGKKCPVCGFPDAPSFAVGTRYERGKDERSSEVVPHTRIIDGVNLRSPDFERLLREGVTTVYVAPDPAAVIGSQGAIVRTGGPISDRIIRETDAVMAAMGTDPSWRGGSNQGPWRDHVSFYARRPTTRMGVIWVFRKAFYDTERHEKGMVVGGADTPSDAAMEALERVLKGEIPLRIQARTQHDILSAMRLSDEFDLPFLLVEATEAYKCIDKLKETGTPVVFGPIYVDAPGMRAWSTEVNESRLYTFRSLLEAGVQTALTAHELRDEDGLARQAMYARRFGVPLDNVLQSVTETPANLLHLSDEIGTIEVGKRADLILWSGEPFRDDSTPVVVWIDGRIVLDVRAG